MGCFAICPKQPLVSTLTFAGVGKTVIAAYDQGMPVKGELESK